MKVWEQIPHTNDNQRGEGNIMDKESKYIITRGQLIRKKYTITRGQLIRKSQ